MSSGDTCGSPYVSDADVLVALLARMMQWAEQNVAVRGSRTPQE